MTHLGPVPPPPGAPRSQAHLWAISYCTRLGLWVGMPSKVRSLTLAYAIQLHSELLSNVFLFWFSLYWRTCYYSMVVTVVRVKLSDGSKTVIFSKCKKSVCFHSKNQVKKCLMDIPESAALILAVAALLSVLVRVIVALTQDRASASPSSPRPDQSPTVSTSVTPFTSTVSQLCRSDTSSQPDSTQK